MFGTAIAVTDSDAVSRIVLGSQTLVFLLRSPNLALRRGAGGVLLALHQLLGRLPIFFGHLLKALTESYYIFCYGNDD